MFMITATQAAEILKLKPVTVRLLCRTGHIEGAVKIGRDWVIPCPPQYINRRVPGKPRMRRDE